MAGFNKPVSFDDEDDGGIAELKAELEALKAKIRAGASGIETEGHDPEERHGAKHESPTGEAGDAQ